MCTTPGVCACHLRAVFARRCDSHLCPSLSASFLVGEIHLTAATAITIAIAIVGEAVYTLRTEAIV
jgi:hypothetical protein